MTGKMLPEERPAATIGQTGTGYRFATERLLVPDAFDALFDAADRQAASQARGPVARSDWLPADGRFDDLDPSEAEEQAERLAGRDV